MTKLFRAAAALLLRRRFARLRRRPARAETSRSGPWARPRPICGRSSSASTRAFSPPRISSSTSIYVQSSANLVQQLAAGSLDIAMSTGLVDPIRAIEQGAPLAIVRFEVQAPPYALLAEATIKSLKELKGKMISLGGPKDITKIIVERMLAPHGVKPGEFDMVFAGATSARASALQAGAVDAAILLPPFNFHADCRRLQRSRPDRRLCARTAVLRHGGQPQLGGEEPGAVAADSCRAQQERRVVLRYEEPGGSRRDDGDGQQHQDRGRRKGL